MYHHTPTGVAKIKKAVSCVDEDVKQWELLCVVVEMQSCPNILEDNLEVSSNVKYT